MGSAAYRTCPVQSFGRARTNPGRATGRDLVIFVDAGVEWGVLRDRGRRLVIRGCPGSARARPKNCTGHVLNVWKLVILFPIYKKSRNREFRTHGKYVYM